MRKRKFFCLVIILILIFGVVSIATYKEKGNLETLSISKDYYNVRYKTISITRGTLIEGVNNPCICTEKPELSIAILECLNEYNLKETKVDLKTERDLPEITDLIFTQGEKSKAILRITFIDEKTIEIQVSGINKNKSSYFEVEDGNFDFQRIEEMIGN